MPVLPAALLVGIVAFYLVIRSSTKVAPTVTFANPTTVIPAASAILAGLAVVAVLVLGSRSDLSPLWVLGGAAAVGLVLLWIGGTTTGTRVVYDRGGRRLAPGRLLGIIAFAMLCLYALTQERPAGSTEEACPTEPAFRPSELQLTEGWRPVSDLRRTSPSPPATQPHKAGVVYVAALLPPLNDPSLATPQIGSVVLVN